MSANWTANGGGFWSFTQSDDAARAMVRVDLGRQWPGRVNPLLYGKFCEHLISNIYGGMEAQILENPTLGRWLFSAGADHKFGGYQPVHEPEVIRQRVENWAKRKGLPDAELLNEAHEDGAAMGWMRVGAREEVTLSPDVGPHGGRAQRVEVEVEVGSEAAGIGQWVYLPLHRTRKYQYRVVARAVGETVATIDLADRAGRSLAAGRMNLADQWQTFAGVLAIPADAPGTEVYKVAITAAAPANIVLGRVLLYPDDHLNGADPEVIGMLRQAKLPLLRWPGGNFVSGWDWHDSIGPVDERPTRPNPAWGGVETNLFGTAEFVAFCRQVGCEPLICVNAGSDLPESAAQWVQYCNGPASTPMGALRAKHGYPQPFGIRYWEIGNELWGKFQVGWTTPRGMADRYVRFAKAMREADATITLIGCGCAWWKDDAWNLAGFRQTEGLLRITADHLLCGGEVTRDDTQADVYHHLTGLAREVFAGYAVMRKTMEQSGIAQPRLAITEAQVFPMYRGESPTAEHPGLHPDDLPRPNTITEALYALSLIHEAIRMGDFVELITHSATVNHGGGLSKVKQRCFGHPVHHAYVMSSKLMKATPVAVHLHCGTVATARKFGHQGPLPQSPVLDVMAGLSADGGELVLMLSHRSASSGPITLQLEIAGVPLGTELEICTLAGQSPTDKNTIDEPERIVPRRSKGRLGEALPLPPFSLTRVALSLGRTSGRARPSRPASAKHLPHGSRNHKIK